MAALSRLGLQVGFVARPHLTRVSATALNAHPLQHGHLNQILGPPTSVPGGRRSYTVPSVVSATILYCQEGITALHVATGTPWYITIPVVALAVNIVRLPFTAQSRRMLQKAQELNPLIQAWGRHHLRVTARKGANGRMTYQEFLKTVMARTKETEDRIKNKQGIAQWKHWASSLAIFPVWLTVIEAIRRMSGGPTGLLGTLSQMWTGKKADGVESVVVSRPSAGEESLWGPGSVHRSEVENAGSALPGLEAAAPVDTSIITPDMLGYEPSFTTGGCLWFPDLTSADPYTILPYMLSGILFVNLMPKNMATFRQIMNMSQSPEALVNPWPFRLRRALMFLALAVGPLTANLPAAVHVYWISSSSFNLLQTKVMEKLMPVQNVAIKPCEHVSSRIQPQPIAAPKLSPLGPLAKMQRLETPKPGPRKKR